MRPSMEQKNEFGLRTHLNFMVARRRKCRMGQRPFWSLSEFATGEKESHF